VKTKLKNASGFTIIEVLIVLAIAGLIMLIVFLAVPALQRNQRNNARNADASRISAAVAECLANRNGVTTSCDSLTLDANFTSTNASELQTGKLGELTSGLTGGPSTTAAQLQFGTTNGGCDTTGTNSGAANSARAYSVVYKLEPDTQKCIGS
jgi:prepilin-type N-terminal cleavage/methylation domain-containing protein